MKPSAALANTAWLAAGVVKSRRFSHALSVPADAQHAWLMARVRRDAGSRYGEAHEFGSITDHASFARQVPMVEWDDVAPWVERIQRGERNVLGAEPVTHLAPTSGSSGARKLIPFAPGLSASFDAAVAPWLADLARQRPGILGGPAYWSISPLATDVAEASAVPIGLADDAEYLGGAKAWLVRQVLPVPAAVRHVRDEDAFWRFTLLSLLRERELRFISVWHPSFLELLTGAAMPVWAELLDAVETGATPWAALARGALAHGRRRPDRSRAAGLRAAGPHDWPRWWPRLQVVSCWGEQAAEPGWRRLSAQLPNVLVQRKGLLATEGVVTVPIGDDLPLAVTSHFFEFLSEAGDIRLAHQLERGGRYEVVLTNGAGLWRYRLGDVVECTGHVKATPSLRFLGRAGRVSDLRGEKLAEVFVAEVLRSLEAPVALQLRAWDDGAAAGYELLVQTGAGADAIAAMAERVERGLLDNPHYALARRLGQLSPVRGRGVASDPATVDLRAEGGARATKLGDVKPRVLVTAHASERTV